MLVTHWSKSIMWQNLSRLTTHVHVVGCSYFGIRFRCWVMVRVRLKVRLTRLTLAVVYAFDGHVYVNDVALARSHNQNLTC